MTISNGDIAVIVGVVLAYFMIVLGLQVWDRWESYYRACVNCHQTLCCVLMDETNDDTASEATPSVLVHLLETRGSMI